MAHCLSCYSYVIHESDVCASCTGGHSHLRVVTDNHKEWTFRYKMIRGKIAETLVEQIFLAHKYSVYRYGMEYTLPGIASSLQAMQREVAARIKNMPDFVVQHRLYKETFFVEVKFRANGCFSEKELDKGYPYQDALIIVVSGTQIKCLSVLELRQGWEITPDCSNYLADRKEFQLRKDVVEDFCSFAEGFFEEEKLSHE